MKAEELSLEAQEQLERWPPKAQRLLDELLEDAHSPLQRELVLRAVGAGHTPAEVHAFADELRALADAEAFAACTLEDERPEDYTVAQLLRAEADPLFAFELKRGELEPADDEGLPPSARETPPAPQAPPLPTDALALGLAGRKRVGFEASSGEAVARRPRPQEYVSGRHQALQPTTGAHQALGGGGARLLEDLVNEATRSLGLSWREHEVDVPGGLTLEDAVLQAALALGRDLPIPCAVGPAPGQSRRFLLVLQVSTSGRARAWQLFDPLSQAVAWVNEGDLLARTELPFADKANRRITRIALPSARSHAY